MMALQQNHQQGASSSVAEHFSAISTILSHLMIQGIDFDFSPKDSRLYGE